MEKPRSRSSTTTYWGYSVNKTPPPSPSLLFFAYWPHSSLLADRAFFKQTGRVAISSCSIFYSTLSQR